MSEHVIPQNVEADDKLIGPFSFRQFVYLIIAVLAGAAAWGLGQVFIIFALIPIPFLIFFGALALPLRKDQPTETYLAAIVQFYTRPHLRRWDPEGMDTLVEITVPRIDSGPELKSLSAASADARFDFLSDLADTRGASIKDSSINPDILLAANGIQDVLAGDTFASESIDRLMAKDSEKRKAEAMNIMKSAAISSTVATTPTVQAVSAAAAPKPVVFPTGPAINPDLYAPAPSVSTPVVNTTTPTPPAEKPTPIVTTSEKVVNPDIMELVKSDDLSIDTLAKQADKAKKDEDDGTFLSLH